MMVLCCCSRLLRTLPDKGQKIREFSERVRCAIEQHDEEERKQSLVSAARTELQSKYQQAFTMQRHAIQNAPAVSQNENAAGNTGQKKKKTSPVSIHVQDKNTLEKKQDLFVCSAAAVETMETAAAGASLNSIGTKEGDLAEALERVRLSETASTGFSSETKDPFSSMARDNYFLSTQIPKKPNYVTVLERTEKDLAHGKKKYKPSK